MISDLVKSSIKGNLTSSEIRRQQIKKAVTPEQVSQMTEDDLKEYLYLKLQGLRLFKE